ncbi:MAG: 3-deoxy-D-manno-octulosonic acid transferase, partial [Planctomycetaceae bacterium]
PEEDMVIRAWKELRSDYPRLRLIVVPRHRERFDSVATLLAGGHTEFIRRSTLASSPQTIPHDTVILLDTIGELAACWGLADLAFVGGTFGTRGGQNMLEPAAYGAAVLFGPNTWNFRDIVRMLLAEQAAVEINSPSDFAGQLKTLLDDDLRRNALGHAARNLVLAQQGAIQQTIQLLMTAVNSADTTPRRSAA